MGIAYPRTGQRVAVIGLADEKAIYHAGGSGSVEPSFVSTPLQGITDAAKALGSQVTFDDGSCALRAAALAKTSDVVLVFVGDSVGGRRPTWGDGAVWLGLAGPSCGQTDELNVAQNLLLVT